MNDSQIRCILAVGEYRNFTNAAESIFLSQSVLSRQIASFEAETGITVFERGKKGVRVTPAGEVLLDSLRRMSRDLDGALQSAQDIQNGVSGSLRIALVAGQTMGKVLPRVLGYFARELPRVRIDLASYSFEGLSAALTQGTVDFVYLPRFAVEDIPGVEYQVLGPTAHFLVVHENHPRFRDRDLCLDTLKNEQVLVVDDIRCRGLFRDIWQRMEELGIRVSVREVDDISAKLLWIESGLALGVVNEHHMLYQMGHVRAIPLPQVDIGPEVIAWQTENLNPVIPAFLKQLRCELDGGAEDGK